MNRHVREALEQRQKSRAEIRNAAANVRKTCTAVAVPVLTSGGMSQAMRAAATGTSSADKKTRSIFSSPAFVVLVAIFLLALAACTGCAWTASEPVRDLGYFVRHDAAALARRHPEDVYAARLVTGTAALARLIGEPETVPDVSTQTADFAPTLQGVEEEGYESSTKGAIVVGVIAIGSFAAKAAGLPSPLVDMLAAMGTAYAMRKKRPAGGGGSGMSGPGGPVAVGLLLAFGVSLGGSGCATASPSDLAPPPAARADLALPRRVRHHFELWCVKTTAGKPAHLVSPAEAYASDVQETEEYILRLEERLRRARADLSGEAAEAY